MSLALQPGCGWNEPVTRVTRGHSKNVDVICAFADDETQVAARFSVPSLQVVPMTGDLTSVGDGEDATVYRVISRWFTWRSETDLQIQLLLAYAHPLAVKIGQQTPTYRKKPAMKFGRSPPTQAQRSLYSMDKRRRVIALMPTLGLPYRSIRGAAKP